MGSSTVLWPRLDGWTVPVPCRLDSRACRQKKGVQEILDASCHQGVSNALVSGGADEGVFTHVDLSRLVVVDGQSLLTQLADRLGMVGMAGREVPNHPDLDG